MEMKVLVADPSAGLRADVAAVLARLHCRVVAEAADGPSALSAFADHNPDIAVLAVDLPGLSGAEAARRLTIDPTLSLVVPCPELVMVMADRLLADGEATDRMRRLLESVRLAACDYAGSLH